MRGITIIGGGLAGLSLGIGLRRHGVPVRLEEAGSYPRHRVCGEFISGVRTDTLEALGIGDLLEPATLLEDAAWHFRDRFCFRHRLPTPGRGLSRHHVDLRLAERFEEMGGELHRNTRRRPGDIAGPGLVEATGRVPDRESNLIGLKVHLLDFEVEADLEMHCAPGGYLGLCRVEDGRVNASGLFIRRPDLKGDRENLQRAYLEACGMNRLLRRMSGSGVDPESCAAVSGVPRGYVPRRKDGACAIGDRFGMIGPFTGNGISMAFEGAETALPALLDYARGDRDWGETLTSVHAGLARRFRRRLQLSTRLHRALLHPAGLESLALLGRNGLLPVPLLFRWLR